MKVCPLKARRRVVPRAASVAQLVAMIVFYIVASLWFHFRRYRYVSRAAQFTMPWPRPRGY